MFIEMLIEWKLRKVHIKGKKLAKFLTSRHRYNSNVAYRIDESHVLALAAAGLLKDVILRLASDNYRTISDALFNNGAAAQLHNDETSNTEQHKKVESSLDELVLGLLNLENSHEYGCAFSIIEKLLESDGAALLSPEILSTTIITLARLPVLARTYKNDIVDSALDRAINKASIKKLDDADLLDYTVLELAKLKGKFAAHAIKELLKNGAITSIFSNNRLKRQLYT